MIQIPPPTIRANVIEFALASHSAEIIASVRRAFVRQNHECKPVHAGHGRRLAPLTCAHVHPSRPAIEPISRYQYTPRRAERQAQFDYLCLLKLLPILTADQPINRRSGFNACRICDGGELGEIRKRWALRIFPCLPGRAGNSDDLRRLSVIRWRATVEQWSFCIQFGYTP